jgi:hypothetical protein
MRWLKWALVAGWVAMHAWLWSLLPPVPRWTLSGVELNGSGITPDGRSLVTSDRTTVSVWNLTDGRRENSWHRPRPAIANRGLVDLVVTPVGRSAIVYDADHGRPVMIDLDSGRTVTLRPLSAQSPANETMVRFSLAFSPDGRTYAQLTRLPNKRPALWVTDLPSATEKLIALDEEPQWLQCTADGRTAMVPWPSPVDGSWNVDVIDLIRGEKVGRLNIGVVHTIQFTGIFTRDDIAAINVVRIANGRMDTEIQFWGLFTYSRVAVVPNMLASCWNADGLLIAGRFTGQDRTGIDGLRLLDKSGDEVRRWPPAPQGPIDGGLPTAGGI